LLPSSTTANFVQAARRTLHGTLLELLEPLLMMLDVLEPQLATVEQELG